VLAIMCASSCSYITIPVRPKPRPLQKHVGAAKRTSSKAQSTTENPGQDSEASDNDAASHSESLPERQVIQTSVTKPTLDIHHDQGEPPKTTIDHHRTSEAATTAKNVLKAQGEVLVGTHHQGSPESLQERLATSADASMAPSMHEHHGGPHNHNVEQWGGGEGETGSRYLGRGGWNSPMPWPGNAGRPRRGYPGERYPIRQGRSPQLGPPLPIDASGRSPRPLAYHNPYPAMYSRGRQPSSFMYRDGDYYEQRDDEYYGYNEFDHYHHDHRTPAVQDPTYAWTSDSNDHSSTPAHFSHSANAAAGPSNSANATAGASRSANAPGASRSVERQ
jgi:hypothetical protein